MTLDDLKSTVAAQYANSPVLMTWIDSLNTAIDPSLDLTDFYNKVWNVLTAEGWGLDVWGRIVGVSRKLRLPNLEQYFGFDESANEWKPFDQGIFWTGQGTVDVYMLEDTLYRKLILAKAYANISDGSIKSVNNILTLLYGDISKSYVRDNHNMTFDLIFETPIPLVEETTIYQSDVIPRPAGVKLTVVNGV